MNLRFSPTRLLLGPLLGVVMTPGLAWAANTPTVKTYSFSLAAYVENSSSTAIYASAPDANLIAVINPTTLQLVTTIPVSSNPMGLCFSADGTKLYVALKGATSLAVINTATNTTLAPIPLAPNLNPTGVALGTSNRLWVAATDPSFGNVALQIDAVTGASTGPSPSGFYVEANDVRTSADGKSLYIAGFGSSPSYLSKFDVSGTTPVFDWAFATGGNGDDFQLSHNGKLVVHINGGGNDNLSPYTDAVYHTSDGSVAGSFHVGAYPSAFAFSPDDLIGYTGQAFNTPNIEIYSLTTFASVGTMQASDNVHDLFVDNTGKYLFANLGATTAVFATGRTAVPEPASAVCCVGGAALLLRRRRGSTRRLASAS